MNRILQQTLDETLDEMRKHFFLFENDCIARQANRAREGKFYDETIILDDFPEKGGPLRLQFFIDIQ